MAWATRDSSAGRGNRCFSVTRGTATKHCSEWAACAVARRQGAWGGEQALWGLGWAAGGPGPGTGCSGPQHVWAPQVITRCGTTRLGAGSGAPPQQASPHQAFPPICSAPRRSPRRPAPRAIHGGRHVDVGAGRRRGVRQPHGRHPGDPGACFRPTRVMVGVMRGWAGAKGRDKAAPALLCPLHAAQPISLQSTFRPTKTLPQSRLRRRALLKRTLAETLATAAGGTASEPGHSLRRVLGNSFFMRAMVFELRHFCKSSFSRRTGPSSFTRNLMQMRVSAVLTRPSILYRRQIRVDITGRRLGRRGWCVCFDRHSRPHQRAVGRGLLHAGRLLRVPERTVLP